jgi:electron transfer flavoprotein-quinone oxidoreductase
MADMRTYANAPHFFQNPRLYTTYPEMLERVMTRIYTGDAQPKEHLLPMLMKSTRESEVSVFDLIRDVMEGLRAL